MHNLPEVLDRLFTYACRLVGITSEFGQNVVRFLVLGVFVAVLIGYVIVGTDT